MNNSKIYNEWASENRFQVGDTIKYWKDYVMQVGEVEYKKCNSSRPNCFSNTGSTIYRLEHPWSFYAISRDVGHCGKG
ncbi:hypothetical protein K2173_013868 [Erythroxylum novogranatense]|uniref:Phytocyanin domain-containing protein n=1 Tax=Erythroxylum novogranatense TaxID=1862640 RepID=A0AAV8SCP5_9ROSI|nr:hypothetical protein K2173_013868 [Erythroxylum novogranatense]